MLAELLAVDVETDKVFLNMTEWISGINRNFDIHITRCARWALTFNLLLLIDRLSFDQFRQNEIMQTKI